MCYVSYCHIIFHTVLIIVTSANKQQTPVVDKLYAVVAVANTPNIHHFSTEEIAITKRKPCQTIKSN